LSRRAFVASAFLLAGCSFDASKLRAPLARGDAGLDDCRPQDSNLPTDSSIPDTSLRWADVLPDIQDRNDLVGFDFRVTDAPVGFETGAMDAGFARSEIASGADVSIDEAMTDLARSASDDADSTAESGPDAEGWSDSNNQASDRDSSRDTAGAGEIDSGPSGLDSASAIVDGDPSEIAPPPGPVFPYTPTNFDPNGLGPGQAAAAMRLDCGVSTFNSSTGAFTNWCGQTPTVVNRSQVAGPDLAILVLPTFTVAAGSSLSLTGKNPVVLAVFGDATIVGVIDASASGTIPGAGGNLVCDTSQGGDGDGSTARFSGASGGGGGGFGTAGGNSGVADTDGRPKAAASGGKVRGTGKLNPLVGGCAGGRAGGCSTDGGAGGGAVQISASGKLTVSGAIRANGADGALPCGAGDEGGGTGGGSGGGILLEASAVVTTAATLEANGGTGGPDGAFFHCGGNAGGAGSTDASKPGTNGINCVAGTPGGGGGYGRISVTVR
jgi:hypothetical protein